jgi:hypothetical protein
METVLVLTQKSDMLFRWLNQLPPEHPVHQDWAALIHWLNDLTKDDLKSLLQEAAEHIAEACCEEEELGIAGGLPTVRKADSMKYFSINTETLAAAADRLAACRRTLSYRALCPFLARFAPILDAHKGLNHVSSTGC